MSDQTSSQLRHRKGSNLEGFDKTHAFHNLLSVLPQGGLSCQETIPSQRIQSVKFSTPKERWAWIWCCRLHDYFSIQYCQKTFVQWPCLLGRTLNLNLVEKFTGLQRKILNGESQFKANENVTSHFETQNDDLKESKESCRLSRLGRICDWA